MKCEKCGKYEANYHYSSNINGDITEKHLCTNCADELGLNKNMFFDYGNIFDEMFGSFFENRRSMLSSWKPVGFIVPTMLLPRTDRSIESEPNTAAAPDKSEVKTDPEMEKRREINMLKEQMRQAAENEDFEKAAELRDKIRKIEK